VRCEIRLSRRDLDLGRAGVCVVGSKVLNDLLLLSHNVCALFESGVPLRAANETTHISASLTEYLC